MTRLQLIFYKLGFGRFKRYRRWVGGLWVERYVQATPHSSELDRWCWKSVTIAKFDDGTQAIEQWPINPPQARIVK